MSETEIYMIRKEILALSRNPRRSSDRVPTPVPSRKSINLLRQNYERAIEVFLVFYGCCVLTFKGAGEELNVGNSACHFVFFFS